MAAPQRPAFKPVPRASPPITGLTLSPRAALPITGLYVITARRAAREAGPREAERARRGMEGRLPYDDFPVVFLPPYESPPAWVPPHEVSEGSEGGSGSVGLGSGSASGPPLCFAEGLSPRLQQRAHPVPAPHRRTQEAARGAGEAAGPRRGTDRGTLHLSVALFAC